MEKLIFVLVVVVATIIHAWWTRKQVEAEQREQERERGTRPQGRDGTSADGSPRPAATPPQRPARLDWEEQMRRLLEGVLPQPPQPPKPRPSAAVPQPVPSPLPSHPPPKPKPAAPPPVLARSNIPVPDEGMEMEVGLPVRPVSLHRVATAHERAQVHANVTERMHATSVRVTSHAGPAVARAGSPLSAEVRGLVGTRRSAQAALVAAAILGPPRAMDPID